MHAPYQIQGIERGNPRFSIVACILFYNLSIWVTIYIYIYIYISLLMLKEELYSFYLRSLKRKRIYVFPLKNDFFFFYFITL